MDGKLETIDLYLDNAVEKIRTKKSIQNKIDIDILWFLRGMCRQLQDYTKKDKKMSKAFSDRAVVFQKLMTLKRKE